MSNAGPKIHSALSNSRLKLLQLKVTSRTSRVKQVSTNYTLQPAPAESNYLQSENISGATMWTFFYNPVARLLTTTSLGQQS